MILGLVVGIRKSNNVGEVLRSGGLLGELVVDDVACLFREKGVDVLDYQMSIAWN